MIPLFIDKSTCWETGTSSNFLTDMDDPGWGDGTLWNSAMQSWGGRDGRDETVNEGHFFTFPSFPCILYNSCIFLTVPLSNFLSHVFSHILLCLPDSWIPFQFFLALCFYFSINPDLVLYTYWAHKQCSCPRGTSWKIKYTVFNLFWN